MGRFVLKWAAGKRAAAPSSAWEETLSFSGLEVLQRNRRRGARSGILKEKILVNTRNKWPRVSGHQCGGMKSQSHRPQQTYVCQVADFARNFVLTVCVGVSRYLDNE